MRSNLQILALCLTISTAHAGFTTLFDEESLHPELNLDIPSEALAEIVFDAAADELDFNTFGNTDMWTQRQGSPIVWAANPELPEGQVWSVETEVRYNGAPDADQRVAGIVFYADIDGVGGSGGGMDFGFGLNDWNNRGVEIQGFGGTQVGDSGQSFINAAAEVGNPGSAFLRIEIEEGGDTDAYTFFYKLEEADEWTELAQFNSPQDNSRVGLFFKNGNGTAEEDRSVSFTYFALDDGSDFVDSDGDGMSDDYEAANDLDPNDDADRDLDSDGDGLTNIREFMARTLANDPDTDNDGARDGIETGTGEWTSASDTGTDPLEADTDGDGLPDGAETNTGTFNGAADTGTDPHDPDTDGDRADDGFEIDEGTDPTDPNSVPENIIGRGDWPVSLDIPNESLASITLDVDNNELDFVTLGNTDMWVERNNAPVAWAPNPQVAEGEMWAVETEVRYNGAEDAPQRVAGLMFYGDLDGLGGSTDGVDFSFGLNDWNNRGVEVQGLGGTMVGDTGQQFINAQAEVGNPSSAFLRAEIVEEGASDLYTLYYKLDTADEWVQLAQFRSDQDNSRVGMVFKNGGNTGAEDRSVSFTYFLIDDGSLGGPFQIETITKSAEGVTLSWSSQNRANYSVDRTFDLAAPEWQELDDNVPSAGETTSFTDGSAELQTERTAWYRVRRNE